MSRKSRRLPPTCGYQTGWPDGYPEYCKDDKQTGHIYCAPHNASVREDYPGTDTRTEAVRERNRRLS